MNDVTCAIKSNKKIADQVYEMEFYVNDDLIERPGQFVDIKLDGFFLRRPISVANKAEGSITLVYKVVGEGTKMMSSLKKGETLDLLMPLGNGYDICKAESTEDGDIYLIGGGLGVPPMYLLASSLIRAGEKPKVILGFNTSEEVFYEDKFAALGLDVTVATVDGSHGIKGMVTDAMPPEAGYVFACGPEPMLKAVYERSRDGQFSFESRMGCGFGACMGCSCRTKYGSKRICKDGPVLDREEIIW